MRAQSSSGPRLLRLPLVDHLRGLWPAAKGPERRCDARPTSSRPQKPESCAFPTTTRRRFQNHSERYAPACELRRTSPLAGHNCLRRRRSDSIWHSSVRASKAPGAARRARGRRCPQGDRPAQEDRVRPSLLIPRAHGELFGQARSSSGVLFQTSFNEVFPWQRS
jgi:hypothetical protein